MISRLSLRLKALRLLLSNFSENGCKNVLLKKQDSRSEGEKVRVQARAFFLFITSIVRKACYISFFFFVFSIVFLTERMAYNKASYIIIYIGYTKKNIEKDIVENGNLIFG